MTTYRTGTDTTRVLAACREPVEAALHASLRRLAEPAGRICLYHLGWQEADGRPAAHGRGKTIRPVLTVLCATVVGGRPVDDPAPEALAAAVAIELVHNFSLLHDDVIDVDTTRRHRPTAWTVFGTGPAIIAGDALLTLALDVLAAGSGAQAGRAVPLLAGAVQNLNQGQLADLDFERRDDVGLDACLRMAEGKTGALLGAACGLGALTAGAGADVVGGLDRAGRELGVAFQLADDLLGIWGDPAVTGKPARGDLRRRKRSLPVVAALTSGTAAAGELRALLRRDDELSAPELDRAAGLVEDTGARQWCRDRAGELVERAVRRLQELTPAGPDGAGALAALTALATEMVRRDR